MAFCWPHLLYSPLGALAYFELVGVATKHLSPTLVALSVALEPLCVSAIGIGFFGYALQPLEVGGYCCAALGNRNRNRNRNRNHNPNPNP